MLNFEKTYKMVLVDDEGNTYKSDDVRLMNADIHSVGPEELYAEIMVSAPRFMIEMNEAGTPPCMPTAEEARLAADVIREEKRKKVIEEEWDWLIGIVCTAVRDGNGYVMTDRLCDENKLRLIELGYDVRQNNHLYWRISWNDPEFLF